MKMSFDDISARLKFISQISENEKINVQTRQIVPNSWWTTVVRTLRGETRYLSYQFVSSAVHDSFVWLDLYMHDSPVLAHQIVDDLRKVVYGIKNLQTTYSSDRMLVSQLVTLNQLIETKLSFIDNGPKHSLPEKTMSTRE